jgi:AraC-like DNA-binding protein
MGPVGPGIDAIPGLQAALPWLRRLLSYIRFMADLWRNDLKSWYPPGRLPGSGLTIRGLACGEEMAASIVDRPRGTGDWLFMSYPQQILLRPGGTERQCAGPVLIVWSPDQGHWYGWRHARWLHSWVHAKGPALDALVAAADVPLGVPIFGLETEVFDACVRAMHHELARPQPDPRLALLQLEILVREAARAASPDADSAPAPWPDIRRHIDEHYAQRLTLAGLARRFQLSPQHLCEGFKRWFGVPPIEYQIRLRLDRARLLLTDRNRSVAAVAADVGWLDVPHFCRTFRRRCGITPGSLREA